MTLSTDLYILDQIEAKQIFKKARQVIGATEKNLYQDQEDDQGFAWVNPGDRTLGNKIGSGLNAWLQVHYNSKGKLATDENAAKKNDEPYEFNIPSHWLRVNFDTAYGYKGEKYSESCSALHTKYLAELGLWLDQKKIAWAWKNEFNGEIYAGAERYIELVNFYESWEGNLGYFEKEVKPYLDQAELFPRKSLAELLIG